MEKESIEKLAAEKQIRMNFEEQTKGQKQTTSRHDRKLNKHRNHGT